MIPMREIKISFESFINYTPLKHIYILPHISLGNYLQCFFLFSKIVDDNTELWSEDVLNG